MATRSTFSVKTISAGSPAREGSAVPERFRSVTTAEPGRSAVPPHFRSVTKPEAPAAAREVEKPDQSD